MSSCSTSTQVGAGPARSGGCISPSDCFSSTPSTSRPSRSGAACSSACLMASSSVTADAEQSEQLPSRRSRATPSDSDSSSTLPPCDSMYGRTCSSAWLTRSASGTGCRSWIMNSVATSGSSAIVVARRAPSSPAANSTSRICSRPAPYICTMADTSSSASCCVATSPTAASRDWRSCTRSTSCSGPSVAAVTAMVPPLRHRRGCVDDLAHLAAAVHVHAAGQAGVERADGPHDVDSLEVLRSVLLEYGGVLDGVLVRARRSERIARARVPGRRRVGLVVRDLALADHHVVGEHAAGSLVEAAADGALGHLELVPALGAAGLYLLHRPLQIVQRDQRRVGLVVGAGAVALDRVRLLRHLPLQLHLRHVGRARQHHLQRVPGGLDVAEVDDAGLGGTPLAGERAAAGVAADVRIGALVIDARRHHPRVLVGEVALLRPRQRHLVPGVVLVDRVAQRILVDECGLVLPAVEVGRP